MLGLAPFDEFWLPFRKVHEIYGTYLYDDGAPGGSLHAEMLMLVLGSVAIKTFQRLDNHSHTVGGRNPAPVDMDNIPLFTRFYTSQL